MWFETVGESESYGCRWGESSRGWGQPRWRLACKKSRMGWNEGSLRGSGKISKSDWRWHLVLVRHLWRHRVVFLSKEAQFIDWPATCVHRPLSQVHLARTRYQIKRPLSVQYACFQVGSVGLEQAIEAYRFRYRVVIQKTHSLIKIWFSVTYTKIFHWDLCGACKVPVNSELAISMSTDWLMGLSGNSQRAHFKWAWKSWAIITLSTSVLLLTFFFSSQTTPSA